MKGGTPWKSLIAHVSTFTSRYILVHSDREIRRLSHQAGIINPITRRILLSAGIDPGCACSTSAVARATLHSRCPRWLAAKVRSSAQIGLRRLLRRRRARGGASVQKVSFHEGDPAALSFDRPFDAVIGRYDLMFQADAVAMLRGVARHLRPGGTIVFHEPDWNSCRSSRQRRPTTTAVDGSSRRSGAAVSRPIWVSSSMRLSARLD